jgi:hypothetical protein
MSGKARRAARGEPAPDDALLPSPANCMRVRGTRRVCDRCGAVPVVLHVPTRQRGQFCPTCCPCCGNGPELERSGRRECLQGSAGVR